MMREITTLFSLPIYVLMVLHTCALFSWVAQHATVCLDR